MHNEQLKKGISDTGKVLAKACKELKAVGAVLDADESTRLRRVEAALNTLSLIDLDALLEMLRRERDELKSRQAAALDQRRESVLKEARKHGWPAHRMQEYDKIGVFDVEYKSIKVVVKIGSERVSDFEEADGHVLFDKLVELKARLDGVPFSREQFFESIRDAIGIARVRGILRNDEAGIRELYPLIVLARLGRDAKFLKRPGPGSFVDYPSYQLAYDFFRFDEKGWVMPDGVRINARPPSMREAGNALVFPSSSDLSKRLQIAAISIRKQGA